MKFSFDKKSELIRGGLAFLIVKMCGIGILFFFSWWSVQNLGVERWGSYAYVITTLNIFLILGVVGIDTLSTKYVADLTLKKDTPLLSTFYFQALFLVFLISSIISSIILFGDYYLKIQFFKFDISERLLLTLSVVLFSLLNLNIAVLRGKKKILEFSILKNVGITGLSFLIVFLAFCSEMNIDESFFISTITLSIFVLLIISFLLLIQDFRNWSIPKMKFNPSILKESLPLMLAGVATTLMGNVDLLMLESFAGTTSVGYYDVLVKIGTVTTLVLMAVNSIAMPKFAELFGSGKLKELEKTVKQSSRLIFWFTIPILLGLFLLSHEILAFYFNENAELSLSLRILLIGQMINTFCGSVGVLLQMTGFQKEIQNILLVALVFNIGMNLILIPKFGVLGAAISSALALSFWNIYAVILAKQKLKIDTFYIPI